MKKLNTKKRKIFTRYRSNSILAISNAKQIENEKKIEFLRRLSIEKLYYKTLKVNTNSIMTRRCY